MQFGTTESGTEAAQRNEAQRIADETKVSGAANSDGCLDIRLAASRRPDARLIDTFAGHHSSDATSRVLHIALATRDEMNVGVTDNLTGYISVVHAYIEATHRGIFLHYLSADLVQQLVDCTALVSPR